MDIEACRVKRMGKACSSYRCHTVTDKNGMVLAEVSGYRSDYFIFFYKYTIKQGTCRQGKQAVDLLTRQPTEKSCIFITRFSFCALYGLKGDSGAFQKGLTSKRSKALLAFNQALVSAVPFKSVADC